MQITFELGTLLVVILHLGLGMFYQGRLAEKVAQLQRQAEQFGSLWDRLNEMQRQIDRGDREQRLSDQRRDS